MSQAYYRCWASGVGPAEVHECPSFGGSVSGTEWTHDEPMATGEVARFPADWTRPENPWWDGEQVREATADELAAHETALDAAWLASAEYRKLAGAAQVIGGIRQLLASVGVEPREETQVFGDVRARVLAATADTAERDNALTAAMDLATMYSKLKELIGDPAGLVSGARVLDLSRPK